MVTQILKIVIQVVDKATAGLKRVKETTKQIDKNLKKVNVNAFRFLGLGLGMLFTGMALQRFFGGFLRAAVNTFARIVDVQDEAFQQVQQLRAAWEFLKFSIIDALVSSELIVNVIDLVIILTDRLGQLSPAALAGIGVIAVVSFIAAGAMLLLGQGMLFLIGISAALQISLGALVTGLGLIMIFGLIVAATFLFLNNKVFSPLEKILIIVGAAVLLLSKRFFALSLTAGFTALLFGGFLILLALLSVKFGGLGNAIKAMAATAIVALGFLADFIITGLLVPFQYLALAIAWIYRLARKPVPAGLEEFIRWKPEVHVAAAVIAARIQPEIVEEKPLSALAKDVGSQIATGLEGVAETIGNTVGASMEKIVETQQDKMGEMTGEQTQDMGGFIEEQTTKLDETMNKIIESQGELVDILQNEAVIVPTTQG